MYLLLHIDYMIN